MLAQRVYMHGAKKHRWKIVLACVVIAFRLVGGGALVRAQAPSADSPAVEQHIHEIIKSLPPGSLLRGILEGGGRGSGVHYSWMDEMKSEGIKRVFIEVHFVWHRRPKEMQVVAVRYFTHYEDNKAEINDHTKLEEFRSIGLEQKLKEEALRRAAGGAWIDLPRPRPKPLLGATSVRLYDDEWLPVLGPTFWVYTPATPAPTP
jgi:hypothetical protein